MADGLALRYAQTLKSASPFRLAPDRLRELLARDVPAELAVALAEAAAAAGPLARRILAQRPMPSTRPKRGRRQVAELALAERRELVAGLAARLAEYVGAAPTPAIVPLFVRSVAAMLDLGPADRGSGRDDRPRAAPRPEGSRPRRCSTAILSCWSSSTGGCGIDRSYRRTRSASRGWLETRWTGQIVPLLGLLGAVGDAAIVREALELEVFEPLARQGIGDPELCRWPLALLRMFDPRTASVAVVSAGAPGPHHLLRLADLVCDLSRRFPSGRATRAALQPIVDGLMAATQASRAMLLADLLDEFTSLDNPPRDALPRLARYLPARRSTLPRGRSTRSAAGRHWRRCCCSNARPDDAPAWYGLGCWPSYSIERRARMRTTSARSRRRR